MGGSILAGNHLRVDVWLAAVNFGDFLAGRWANPGVVIERLFTIAGERLGDHDPGVGVAENSSVLLVARRVG